jgi:hypothetical protein
LSVCAISEVRRLSAESKTSHRGSPGRRRHGWHRSSTGLRRCSTRTSRSTPTASRTRLSGRSTTAWPPHPKTRRQWPNCTCVSYLHWSTSHRADDFFHNSGLSRCFRPAVGVNLQVQELPVDRWGADQTDAKPDPVVSGDDPGPACLHLTCRVADYRSRARRHTRWGAASPSVLVTRAACRHRSTRCQGTSGSASAPAGNDGRAATPSSSPFAADLVPRGSAPAGLPRPFRARGPRSRATVTTGPIRATSRPGRTAAYAGSPSAAADWKWSYQV